MKYLQLGAAGVQLATRFVTTNECDASIDFKCSHSEAKKEDLVIIQSPVGMPGRAIRNQFLDDVGRGVKKPYKCPYCIALALINAKKGKLRNGFAFAGANAFREKEIVSVKERMDTLQEEFEAAIHPQPASLRNARWPPRGKRSIKLAGYGSSFAELLRTRFPLELSILVARSAT